MCSNERAGWLGFPDLGLSNLDLGKQAENFCHMNTSAWLPGLKPGMNFSNEFCINCSDTAIRVAKAMIGAKLSYNRCVSPCLLCFSNFSSRKPC